ncbi:MAG: cytochrome c oxidase subunit I [Kouleothrix sp.]|nr:cytochrome c oxidase subunit I [Kouleothrix sp.]
MATVDRPIDRAPVLKPAKGRTGWSSWLSTVDHKQIGIMYLISAFFFFIIGGIEALLIRVQLGTANNTFLSPDAYNQIFTMHATTMVFLAIMPMLVGFGNYFVPLMIGARDMAFPRLNALSIWLFIFGGLMLYSSFITGGAPAAGWFAYAPLSEKPYSPTTGMDYWVVGLLVTGVASIAGALNFIVTVLNMRAPGMTFNRMPLFVWTNLVTSFLIIFAFPSLTVAQIMLFFDRQFGTHFFLPSGGGDPLLWQHMFWFFGHPEVYIMILPAMGMISEILPTFARKPIFGYAFIAYSTVAIGFLGFAVWAHHMFATGMGPLVNGIFSAGSFLIGVPTGVKIFNWIATLYLGNIRLKTPLYFAVGFVAMFIIGGISGVTLASPQIDLQQTDTYYVVGHIHYVLFGGSIFAIFAGFYYWFPKMTGKMYNERLGKLQFWLMLIAFNVTFFPMHILGTEGMPRRYYTYEAGMGWELWNLIETIGAFALAFSILMFIWNMLTSLRNGAPAPADPWDAATLEWAVPSPPPAHNFDKIPTIYSRRPLWDSKYPDLEVAHAPGAKAMTRGEASQRERERQGAHAEEGAIHMPSSTFFPLILAFGVTVAGYGAIYRFPVQESPFSILMFVGLAIMAYAIAGWVRAAHADAPGH